MDIKKGELLVVTEPIQVVLDWTSDDLVIFYQDSVNQEKIIRNAGVMNIHPDAKSVSMSDRVLTSMDGKGLHLSKTLLNATLPTTKRLKRIRIHKKEK